MEDRKRWEIIQQSYDSKIAEMQALIEKKDICLQQQANSSDIKLQNFEKEKKQLVSTISSLKHENLQLDNHCKQYKLDLSKCETEYNNKLLDYEKQIQMYKSNKKSLESEISQLEALASNQQKQINVSNAKNDVRSNITNDNLLEIQSLNKQLIHCKQTIGSLEKENENLKQLEQRGQDMVQRLLQRLEKQINTNEKLQKELHAKEKQFETEMAKLEDINLKLQANLSALSATNHTRLRQINTSNNNGNTSSSDNPTSTMFASNRNSIKSMKTVDLESHWKLESEHGINGLTGHTSTIGTPTRLNVNTGNNENEKTRSAIKSMIGQEYELIKLQSENEALKKTIETLRQQIISPEKLFEKTKQATDNAKYIAHQTVIIERLKSDLMQNISGLNQFKTKCNELELNVANLKDTVNHLQAKNTDQKVC